jgi:hypothetical protein
MGKLSYINSRGESIEVKVTQHARLRFCKRWAYVFPTKFLPDPVDDVISTWFNKAHRLDVKSRKYRTRLRRHGKDTLYFLTPPFIFIVQSTFLKTVELGTSSTRRLNNNAPARAGQIFPSTNSASIATKMAPHQLPVCRIGAYALDEEGNTKAVNLGSYDSEDNNGEAESIRNDSEFLQEAILRFKNKKPTWKLCTIFAHQSKGGEVVIVFDNTNNLPTSH